jgi:transcriptional regulator GlxA family with amidase domain
MTMQYAAGPGWVPLAIVRRAAAFIEAGADRSLTLADIAAAAGVTGRALQSAFRRHYDNTPVGYLRQARLERAYTELQDADPAAGATVAAVARRWGWTSPGQFAAAYQRRFGEPPSRTLRT